MTHPPGKHILTVLDVESPGLTGFEVARRLRAQPETSGIPLIAATGYSPARRLDLALQHGLDAMVVRPCELDMLVEEIERLLARGPSQRLARPFGCGTA